MLKSDILGLKAGDRLFLRSRDQHFPDRVSVLDVDVTSYEQGVGAYLTIYHNGQAVHSVLYESGRTPYRHGFLVTDFFRELPSRDVAGHYEYRPFRAKHTNPDLKASAR